MLNAVVWVCNMTCKCSSHLGILKEASWRDKINEDDGVKKMGRTRVFEDTDELLN